MGARVKLLSILFSILAPAAYSQGIPYQLNPPAPNARVQFCPVPDGGYPCPTLTTVYSDSATTQVINQPISTGSSGNLSVYFAAGTSSVTIQLLGQGYGPQNRFVVSLGGGGVVPNQPLPASSSGPGPVFNVKNYGAKGDTQRSTNASLSGSTIVTCTDCNFTQADVGKTTSCKVTGGGTQWTNVTIASVTNSTTANISSGAGNVSCGTFTWGTLDDTNVATAVTAFNAALKVTTSGSSIIHPSILTAAPTLYFPAGDYTLNATQLNVAPGGSKIGGAILGDGSGATVITALPGYTPSSVITVNQTSFFRMQGFTLDGVAGAASPVNGAIQDNSSSTQYTDVQIRGFATSGITSSNSVYMLNVLAQQNGGDGFVCTGCNGEIRASGFSNNNRNVIIQLSSNGVPTGNGTRFYGNLIDECNSPPCTRVLNSTDVWFTGGSAFTGMSVDGTSYVHLNGGIYGPFNTDSNSTGLAISSGGVVEASDVRFISSGTGKCINNSGTFINNGANSCETMFASITAASSSGTTATLTVTTQGANVSATCAVGDTIQVQNVGVLGYNGYFKGAVTAVGTNTISYTTPGSNLGASSGGTMFCKGFTTYTGTLPYSSITPTPNTCYVTGTFAAITLCNQFLDRAINIYRIKASSSVTTACTVAPVVTISDGTNSATLTITTAKASWDSSVDASTNVGNTIYVPHGGTLTVSTTAGTCTTAPTNFALTYTMQAVLDN